MRTLLVASALACMDCALGPHMDRPGYDRDMGSYPEKVESQEAGSTQTGIVSFYADKFHGRKTASGAIFDKHAFTAAHRSLPFGTRIEVTNLDNGRSVMVVVNDRGPFAEGRILDVSQAAAKELGFLGKGTTRARITVR